MPVIGLTGGIATGKSTVGRMLAERGAKVISADDASRAVSAPGSAVNEAIARELGSHFLRDDGSLDRPALGNLVFSDPAARRKLEAITHPAILQELRRIVSNSLSQEPDGLIVVEAPLLFEAGMDEWFDAILTVTAEPEVQKYRLMQRSGMSSDEAEARIASQMPVSEKAARSQFVIRNDGGLGDLGAAVVGLLPALRDVVKRQSYTAY